MSSSDSDKAQSILMCILTALTSSTMKGIRLIGWGGRVFPGENVDMETDRGKFDKKRRKIRKLF